MVFQNEQRYGMIIRDMELRGTNDLMNYMPMTDEPLPGMAGNGRAPPYVKFQKVKQVIQAMRRGTTLVGEGLPDTTAPTTRQILTTFRFLDLIDHSRRPTANLRRMVSAVDGPQWSSVLRDVIQQAYAEFPMEQLSILSRSAFVNVFRDTYPSSTKDDNVGLKSRRFFLSAIVEAEMPITDDLKKALRPRLGLEKNLSMFPAPAVPLTDIPCSIDNGIKGAMSTKDVIWKHIVRICDPEDMSDSEVRALLVLQKYLERKQR
jgi:hypothetical protein